MPLGGTIINYGESMKRLKQWSKDIIKNIPVMWLIVLTFVPVMIMTNLIMGAIFQKIAYRQVSASAKTNMMNTLSQAASVLDNRMSDIEERFQLIENSSDMTSLALIMTKNQVDRVGSQYYINLRKRIDDLFVSSAAFLDSAIIDFNDGRFQLYHCEDIPVAISFDYDTLNQQNHSLYNWIYPHDDSIFQVTDVQNRLKNNRVVTLYRLYGRPGQTGRGGIVFNIKESMFRDMLMVPGLSEHGYVALIDDGQLTSYKDVDERYLISEDNLRLLQQSEDITDGQTVKSISGQRMVAYTRHLKTNHWMIAAFIPENEMYQEVRLMKKSMNLVITILIISSILISVILSRIIVRPIRTLTDTVAVDNITTIGAVIPGGAREIWILSDKINELLLKVRQLVEQVRQEQEKKRQAELSLMQEQINPHFLYNTLYSVQELCELDEAKEASTMVLALSNFFRIGISRGGDIITIGEEINHVKNYLIIQHMKYGEKFEYQLNVDPLLLSCKILKLTLQPLVENALHHGIQQQSGKGLIAITGKEVDGYVSLEVRDSGAGMTKERLEEVHRSIEEKKGYENVSFGLKNVFLRLQLHYRGKAEFTISSREHEGTVITIRIPKDWGKSNVSNDDS